MAEPEYQELLAENRRLLEENQRLVAENERLRKRVEALEAQVRRLTEALQNSQRAEKRQAAPFSKRPPSANPKRPGRKPGEQYGPKAHREAPPHIDEVYDAPLPDACPNCGGTLEETAVVSQYQTEIPRQPIYREFHIHLGICPNCGQCHQGRHELQTSDALGAAAAQLGPEAQAAAVVLNKQAGLSYGKIVQIFQDLFGIRVSRGGLAQAVLRTAQRCQQAYENIRVAVSQSPTVTPDETGWRVGGVLNWLHVLVGTTATCFQIDKHRGAEVAAGVLGWDYSGVLTHDGWASYDRFEQAMHQQCVAHALRRARELRDAAHGRGVEFPQQIIRLLLDGLECRDLYRAGLVLPEGLDAAAVEFAEELHALTSRPRSNPDQARFAKHLSNHLWDWFTFLLLPEADATNFRAEQALRGPIVNRKVWGGNRTDNGAEAQSILSSVLATCRQQAQPVLDFFSQTLRGLCPPLFRTDGSGR